MKRHLLFSFLPFLAASLLTADQPNVLVIMTDDQGLGQMSFTDRHRDPALVWRPETTQRYEVDLARAREAAEAAMPNLEQLGQKGVRFSNAFVASPVCSPSRAAFVSARYPQRYRIYSNDDAKAGVSLQERFLPEVFQENGYRTAMIGKWHLGDTTRTDLPEETRDYHRNAIVGVVPEHHPLERGFDYYFGFNRSGANYWNPTSIFRNRERIDVEGYLTDAFSREAVGFIEKRGKAPFFLFLSYSAPHIPLHVPAPAHYRGRFETGNANVDNYYAALAAVDDGIGRILSSLRVRNELSNTLVFFLSDNGAVIDSPMPMNGAATGNKGTLLPGGLQVPFIVSYGDRFLPGTVRSQLVSAMDILPTALDFAGLEIPSEPLLDGRSLRGVLEQPHVNSGPHRFLFWAGPQAWHWSPRNLPFWRNYFAYVTGREGAVGNVPRSAFVEAEAAMGLAATDGHRFYQWIRDPGSGKAVWNLRYAHSLLPGAEGLPATEMLEEAREWLEPMPPPRVWRESAPRD